jgi:hypothetical protein
MAESTIGTEEESHACRTSATGVPSTSSGSKKSSARSTTSRIWV